MKDFLFVCGCARSGTSALVHLLSASDDIVLGMERFGHLVKSSDFQLKKEMFEKERFFSMRPNDTFYDDFEKFHKFDARIRGKFDSSKYIGDKRPDLYLAYDQLFENFPDAKVIFIYRDVKSVASSYEARVVRGDNWPASKDFKRAVIEWNQSLYFTKEAIARGYNICVVDYDSVFCSDKSLDNIFEYLEVKYTDEIKERVLKLRLRSKQLENERVSLLSEDQEEYIAENAKEFLLVDMNKSRLV